MMAPEKRKRTVPKATAGAKPARVTCPACQKEVPSFFVNSHLDLECLVLKSSRPPTRPPTQLPIRPPPGDPPPPLDRLQGQTLRIEESIRKSYLEEEHALLPSSLETAKRKGGDLQRYETEQEISSGIIEHKEYVSLDEEDDDVSDWAHEHKHGRELPTNNSLSTSSFRDSDPWKGGRIGHYSVERPLQGTRILSQYPSIQPIHEKDHGGEGASLWRLATSSHIFPPLPSLKLKAPRGLQVLENFISVEEEEHLLHCLDTDVSNPWKPSRVNGPHQGKSYGNHIFGDSKRRVVSQLSGPMPTFILPYVERMRDQVPVLKDFLPNEMNSIDYRKRDGHYLKAHMDDRRLSGTVLVNLSLAGSCFMTYTRERGLKEAYRVNLLPRSLQILTGESRYNYTHGIQKNDIIDPRRVSMTFRQSVESSQTVRPSR